MNRGLIMFIRLNALSDLLSLRVRLRELGGVVYVESGASASHQSVRLRAALRDHKGC